MSATTIQIVEIEDSDPNHGHDHVHDRAAHITTHHAHVQDHVTNDTIANHNGTNTDTTTEEINTVHTNGITNN